MLLLPRAGGEPASEQGDQGGQAGKQGRWGTPPGRLGHQLRR